MSKIKNGDTIKVHYTGKFDDGEVFDSSQDREPLQFIVGSGQVIKGFDDGVIGLEAGDKKTIKIDAENAYGAERPDLIQIVERKHFPEHIKIEKDQFLELRQPDGSQIVVKIKEMNDNEVTLDANHPLAGKDLTFEIEIVEVV